MTTVRMNPSCCLKRQSKEPYLHWHCSILPSSFPKELLKPQMYLCAKANSTFDQFTQPRDQLSEDGHIQILQALGKGKERGREKKKKEKRKVMVADLSWCTSSWGCLSTAGWSSAESQEFSAWREKANMKRLPPHTDSLVPLLCWADLAKTIICWNSCTPALQLFRKPESNTLARMRWKGHVCLRTKPNTSPTLWNQEAIIYPN